MSFRFIVVHCRGAAPARGAVARTWMGRPLTRGGYAIVVLTVTGLAVAALISASPAVMVSPLDACHISMHAYSTPQ
jgi:hypothetical protein